MPLLQTLPGANNLLNLSHFWVLIQEAWPAVPFLSPRVPAKILSLFALTLTEHSFSVSALFPLPHQVLTVWLASTRLWVQFYIMKENMKEIITVINFKIENLGFRNNEDLNVDSGEIFQKQLQSIWLRDGNDRKLMHLKREIKTTHEAQKWMEQLF